MSLVITLNRPSALSRSMNPRIGGMKSSRNGYRLISTPMFIRSPSTKSVSNGDSHVARVPGLHVARGREVRRFVSEPEAALRIILIKEVSDPDFGAPVFP